MLGIKLVETLKITFEKDIGDDKTAYKTVNFDDITRAIGESQDEITQRIGQWISEGSGWVIDTIDKHCTM